MWIVMCGVLVVRDDALLNVLLIDFLFTFTMPQLFVAGTIVLAIFTTSVAGVTSISHHPPAVLQTVWAGTMPRPGVGGDFQDRLTPRRQLLTRALA